jgi:hypothetical protein
VTAQDALRTALREALGPAARSRGYRGSGPNWRKSSASGDYAVVNVQSSSWSTSESLRCAVNIAFAPEPWLRWQREHYGDGMPKTITESLGLYRERLYPSGTPEGAVGWWEVADVESARLSVADMNAQLDVAGWPVLEDMFTREVMMSRLRGGDLGVMKRSGSGVFFARAEAVLLMVDGPSDALEAQLRHALDNGMPAQRERAERFDAWVRAEAARS